MNKEELIKKLEELEEDNYKEQIHLRGQLINIIKKEIKEEKDATKKAKLELGLYDELKKHDLTIDKYKNSGKYISIPEKVGLKVQEISTAIKLFMKKHDIIGKVKQAGINTATGGAIAVAISLALAAVTGGVSLATLAATIPSVSYIGLSSLLKSFTNKTTMEKLLDSYDNKDKNAEELKEYIKKYIIANVELQESLKEFNSSKNVKEKANALNKLINDFEILIKNAPTDEIKYCIQNEQTGYMHELKKCYLKIRENYIHDKEKMTVSEFATLEKEITALNMKILENEYFLKDAVKDAAKNTGYSVAIMTIARMALSAAFPSLAITSINDMLTPAAMVAISNILSIPSFKDKIPLKPSEYKDKIMKMDKEKFKEKLREKMIIPEKAEPAFQM